MQLSCIPSISPTKKPKAHHHWVQWWTPWDWRPSYTPDLGLRWGNTVMIWELLLTFYSAWNFSPRFFCCLPPTEALGFWRWGKLAGIPRRIQLLDILRFHGVRGEVQNISPTNSEPCKAFARIALLILLQIKGEHLSHEKKTPTFHYTGWLLGILIMVIIIPI